MTAALHFHEPEQGTTLAPQVEVRPVVPPGWLGEGPLKSFYGAALKHPHVEPGPTDPFVVVFTPSGSSTDHMRRVEDMAHQTSKAFTAAGLVAICQPGKRGVVRIYCMPRSEGEDLRSTAAESLRRMWARLWK